jgi:hypothetical protein
VATPGNGNDAITRSIVANLDDTVALVVVNWSYLGRFEFYFHDRNWQNFRSPSSDTNLDNRISALRKYFLAETTPEYEYYKYLHEIVFLQNYLKARNIPYIFSTADDHSFDRKLIHELGNEHINLLGAIDFKQWHTWNTTRGTPCGFLSWAQFEAKLPIGKYGHPLEEAHRLTFELIKHKVDKQWN